MRKIIVSIHSSLDGVVTGPKDDPTNFMTWAQEGIEDSTPTFHENFKTVDTILMGHATFDDLRTKWPSVADWANGDEETLRLGKLVNETAKLVVGHDHIDDLTWGEFAPAQQIVGDDVEKQLRALKSKPGGDIMTFGSPTLVQALTNADLVDEYRIILHPVIPAEGRQLFANTDGRKDFRLTHTRTFAHGALLVHYEPIDKAGS